MVLHEPHEKHRRAIASQTRLSYEASRISGRYFTSKGNFVWNAARFASVNSCRACMSRLGRRLHPGQGRRVWRPRSVFVSTKYRSPRGVSMTSQPVSGYSEPMSRQNDDASHSRLQSRATMAVSARRDEVMRVGHVLAERRIERGDGRDVARVDAEEDLRLVVDEGLRGRVALQGILKERLPRRPQELLRARGP